ncbi:uncharacterized protein B0T15DRAFT_286927 [Chaetomium strumarium]|uniref:Uncharacterized protein n=1 Tax=Chaetomium strumarium TaxID=1170767 RepID=A0AAJ0GL72_9PEZI|nr:hypothetical protein B0T15DRAFT_286927 [Chaetomium strumarium]
MVSIAPTSLSASSVVPSTSKIPTSVDEAPRTIRFTNVEHLRETIESTTSDILIVTDITPAQFADFDREDGPLRGVRFRQYNSNSQILIITIPTRLHEALHLELYQSFMRDGQNWSIR